MHRGLDRKRLPCMLVRFTRWLDIQRANTTKFLFKNGCQDFKNAAATMLLSLSLSLSSPLFLRVTSTHSSRCGKPCWETVSKGAVTFRRKETRHTRTHAHTDTTLSHIKRPCNLHAARINTPQMKKLRKTSLKNLYIVPQWHFAIIRFR